VERQGPLSGYRVLEIEMIASTDGPGYAIFNAQQYFQSSRIVVGMLTSASSGWRWTG